MALPSDHPEFQAAFEQLAKVLLEQNPHFFDPAEPYTDEEYEAMLKEWEDYYQHVAEPLSQQLGSLQLSDIINEDRGE